MTTPVTREEFDEYRKAHHDSLNVVTRALGDIQCTQSKIVALLSGNMEGKPGLTHRVDTLERAASGSWLSQRRDKVVDALLVGAVLTLFVLGIKAFIRDAVKDLSAVQSPKGTMIPVERDPTTRLAFTQEH